MADITDTLARIIKTQADELIRLRKVNADLIDDTMHQARTIRKLIDQRGAVAQIAVPIGPQVRNWYNGSQMRMSEICEALEVTGAIVTAIIYGIVEPIGALRQNIEELIDEEVGNGR